MRIERSVVGGRTYLSNFFCYAVNVSMSAQRPRINSVFAAEVFDKSLHSSWRRIAVMMQRCCCSVYVFFFLYQSSRCCMEKKMMIIIIIIYFITTV